MNSKSIGSRKKRSVSKKIEVRGKINERVLQQKCLHRVFQEDAEKVYGRVEDKIRHISEKYFQYKRHLNDGLRPNKTLKALWQGRSMAQLIAGKFEDLYDLYDSSIVGDASILLECDESGVELRGFSETIDEIEACLEEL